MSGTIESIQVGRSQCFDPASDSGKPWQSAIIKVVVTGPVSVVENGLIGDEQSDLVHHGGPDKAVLAYGVSHYAYWQSRYPEHGFSAGGFGENLTVSGFDESTCCIGDVWQVGSCLLEISQPRQPCWKLSRRWSIDRLAQEVQDQRRTGWYLRVLQSGRLQAGEEIQLVERRNPKYTIEYALGVMYANPRAKQRDWELGHVPQLSISWRTNLLSRATRHGEHED
ncbi:MAG: MOSC domain-containing protein [Planctomycetaceae bacterium]|nr:MOSC domain-containing protein [Planctomycetaceae bacterium]